MIEHAFILSKEESIGAGDLPAYLGESSEAPNGREDALDEVEKEHLVRSYLKSATETRSRPRAGSGLSRSTLYRNLEQYGLADQDYAYDRRLAALCPLRLSRLSRLLSCAKGRRPRMGHQIAQYDCGSWGG